MSLVFSARRAHREPSWTRSRNSSWGFLHKASQLRFYFTQSSSALFCFFQRSDDTARFCNSGAQHRLGRVFVFSAPRPRLGFVLYLVYIPAQTRGSFPVGLYVRLFVCLSLQVCLFLCLCFLQYSDRDSGSSFIYYIYLLFATGTDPL